MQTNAKTLERRQHASLRRRWNHSLPYYEYWETKGDSNVAENSNRNPCSTHHGNRKTNNVKYCCSRGDRRSHHVHPRNSNRTSHISIRGQSMCLSRRPLGQSLWMARGRSALSCPRESPQEHVTSRFTECGSEDQELCEGCALCALVGTHV